MISPSNRTWPHISAMLNLFHPRPGIKKIYFAFKTSNCLHKFNRNITISMMNSWFDVKRQMIYLNRVCACEFDINSRYFFEFFWGDKSCIYFSVLDDDSNEYYPSEAVYTHTLNSESLKTNSWSIFVHFIWRFNNFYIINLSITSKTDCIYVKDITSFNHFSAASLEVFD